MELLCRIACTIWKKGWYVFNRSIDFRFSFFKQKTLFFSWSWRCCCQSLSVPLSSTVLLLSTIFMRVLDQCCHSSSALLNISVSVRAIKCYRHFYTIRTYFPYSSITFRVIQKTTLDLHYWRSSCLDNKISLRELRGGFHLVYWYKEVEDVFTSILMRYVMQNSFSSSAILWANIKVKFFRTGWVLSPLLVVMLLFSE